MSTWDSPEHRALDDAQMELNIAADRWHDFPFSEEAANELRSAIEAYRVARDAWVRLVAGPAEADLVGEPAGAMPAPADPACTCGHQHAGPETGGICVGCPCEGAKA